MSRSATSHPVLPLHSRLQAEMQAATSGRGGPSHLENLDMDELEDVRRGVVPSSGDSFAAVFPSLPRGGTFTPSLLRLAVPPLPRAACPTQDPELQKLHADRIAAMKVRGMRAYMCLQNW